MGWTELFVHGAQDTLQATGETTACVHLFVSHVGAYVRQPGISTASAGLGAACLGQGRKYQRRRREEEKRLQVFCFPVYKGGTVHSQPSEPRGHRDTIETEISAQPQNGEETTT
jgi:hypothetical protein